MEREIKRESGGTPIIKVIGVGGCGCNIVNDIKDNNINDITIAAINTDVQHLRRIDAERTIAIGNSFLDGIGAGNDPLVGKRAAEDSEEEIRELLGDGTKMLFIAAGFAGGTGTGAAPVIAKIAKDMGILTVAFIFIPNRNEGKKRLSNVIYGVKEIQENVDSLLIVCNEKITELYGNMDVDKATLEANKILIDSIRGISEIVTIYGKVNIDFNDVKTVLSNSKGSIMGQGEANGDDRVKKAIVDALDSPLLRENDISGARDVLVNIKYNTLMESELNQILSYIQELTGYTADIIWGRVQDEKMEDKISVTIVATGFSSNTIIKGHLETAKIFSKHNPEQFKDLLEGMEAQDPTAPEEEGGIPLVEREYLENSLDSLYSGEIKKEDRSLEDKKSENPPEDEIQEEEEPESTDSSSIKPKDKLDEVVDYVDFSKMKKEEIDLLLEPMEL